MLGGGTELLVVNACSITRSPKIPPASEYAYRQSNQEDTLLPSPIEPHGGDSGPHAGRGLSADRSALSSRTC